MENENITMDESILTEEDNATETTPVAVEEIPSMEDFKDQLEASFRKIKEGDLLKGTIIGVSETEAVIDLGYYTEGIVPIEEVSNDPSFSIHSLKVGDSVSATVISEDDGEGHLVLSLKKAANVLAWEVLKEYMDKKKPVEVKISEAVNAGVVCYLEGIRGFIPASQLSLTYVEDVTSYVGQKVTAYVITVEEENKKLVLSVKEVEKEKALKDKNSRIAKLQKGLVTVGVVEKIMPFGAFVNIGEELTGLVHISQICGRRIKSPNEVLKVGDQVTVKVIDIKDGKISLSMTAAKEEDEVIEDVAEVPASYSTGEEATTGLGSLLANLKL